MRLSRIRPIYFPNQPFGSFDGSPQSHRKWLPRRLLLVRHGESIANVHREVYSSTPDWHIPLTAQGREQARDCGRRLRRIVGDGKVYIYYSPYERTKQTLHEIRKSFSDEQIQGEREDERLREQEIGNYQPMSSMDKYWADRALFSRLYYRFPDGESSADVGDRVSAFFDALLRERLGLTVPNMNDENFTEGSEKPTLSTFSDAWRDDEEAGGERQAAAAATRPVPDGPPPDGYQSPASVHARFMRENGDHRVSRPVAPPTAETTSGTPSVARGGTALGAAEAAGVHALWVRENGDMDAVLPAPELDNITPPTHRRAAAATQSAFPASSPSTRWRHGSGPARLSRADMATEFGCARAGSPSHASAAGSEDSAPDEGRGDTADAIEDAENVIIVSHGLLIRLFIGRWFRVPMEVFETMSNPPNCAIVVLERDDEHDRLVMTEMSKSLFGSDPLLQMMKFDGNEDAQWYRERFLGIIDPELAPSTQLGEDDDENHYSLSTKHNSALGAPLPRPRPRVSPEAAAAVPTTVTGFATGARVPETPSPLLLPSNTASTPTARRDERNPLRAIDRYYDAKK